MPILSRRRVIAAKVEGTEGTAEAITVADAGILAMDVKFDTDIKVTRRAIRLNTLSNLAPVIGARAGSVSFTAELKGSGGASYTTVGPALAPYLKGCGFAETLAAASATYKPASTGVPSLTIWVYEDGTVKKLKGCRGNVKFRGKVGEPCYADFSFTGVYDAVADLAMISPTIEATVPPALLSSLMTIDAYSGIYSSFSFDMSNEVGLRESANSATGYLSALITGRQPKGTLDPEFVTVATYDFYGKMLAGTPVAFNLGAIANGTCNKVQITAPKLVYAKVGEGDRTGYTTAELDFDLCMNTGDDEISLVFAQ
jgi:hypothetical protein